MQFGEQRVLYYAAATRLVPAFVLPSFSLMFVYLYVSLAYLARNLIHAAHLLNFTSGTYFVDPAVEMCQLYSLRMAFWG
jgi:hypothetical protein